MIFIFLKSSTKLINVMGILLKIIKFILLCGNKCIKKQLDIIEIKANTIPPPVGISTVCELLDIG